MLFACHILLLVGAALAETDYYQILGVDKHADDRTIRKAFKKLAIQKHPDKNKDNPEAHAEFVTINKAYEVLKDEELRKKYDKYGEKGLEDGFNGGNNYQSWQFYNDNFGIYDDDAEIVTLNRADFQRLVTDSTDTWFINFYSTYCSHCHQLAPTWRKFAREMEGVIRIGAVNCAEDPGLCQSQRVGAYPSLVVYPTGEFYQGVRDVEMLVEYAMSKAHSEVLHIREENVESLSNEWEPYRNRPWVIDFCDTAEECLSEQKRRMLSVMLDGLANVASIDCRSEEKLCEELGHNDGVVYYQTGSINKEHEKKLDGLDVKELTSQVIANLDDLDEIDDAVLSQLFDEFEHDEDTLVIFVADEENLRRQPYLKRLFALLPETRIFYADCSTRSEMCAQHVDMKNLPQSIIFKKIGGYEVDYAKSTSHQDLAQFVREAVASPLHVLSPAAYKQAQNSGAKWIIDYFAPWCPPCLKLISEYRRLHRVYSEYPFAEGLNIGLLDCQKYDAECKAAGVQSYPTSILHTPDGKTHRIVGFHHMDYVADFIDNAMNPAVEEITPETFDSLVLNRADDVTWIIDFFAPWCGPCQQLAPELQKAARALIEDAKFGSVDCQAHGALCRQHNIGSYPTIRLYTAAAAKRRKASYDYPQNMWRNADSISRWVYSLLPSLVQEIGNDFWNTVLDADEPWMVDFFAPWCGHCVQFAPVYEKIAKVFDGKVKFAKVDCDQWPGVCQAAMVQSYPSIRLYKGRVRQERQSVWGVQINTQHQESVIQIIQQQLGIQLGTAHDEL